MKNLLLMLCLCIAATAWSQESMQATQKVAQSFLAQNEKAIVSLGNAIPEEKYGWKPAEGVRSVGEVLLHVAQGNYYLLMNIGIPPPATIDMMGMEKIQGKAKIIETLEASFKFVNDNILSIKDNQLNDKVKFPWAEMSKHAALYLMVDHTGEHKGQLIAYARSNGVVPPWSN